MNENINILFDILNYIMQSYISNINSFVIYAKTTQNSKHILPLFLALFSELLMINFYNFNVVHRKIQTT